MAKAKKSTGGDPVDWDDLLARLLHETQMHIIEAMRWIGRPMSANELTHVFDGSAELPNVSYHVRRLKDLGVLTAASVRPVRGADERFYRFAATAK